MAMSHDHRECELQNESQARICRERREIAEIEHKFELRRPILTALARSSATCLRVDDLSSSEGLAGLSRVDVLTALLELEDECCVHGGVVDGERRFALTDWGRCELSRHLAFGAPEPPPPPPTHEEIEAFLEEALDAAVFRVLPGRGPEEAADRLREIAREAHAEGLAPLASRAEAALAGLG